MFFGKHVRRSMSRTTIILKFKMSLLFEKMKKQTATTTEVKENKLKRL